MGFNVITVGAVENTYPYERIQYYEYDDNGDYVKHASAYNFDGQSLSDRRTLKPDVMAPGRYSSCWGTSFSAPLVSASIALMCEYKPALKTQQFIVKAILAATTAKVKTESHFVTREVDFRMSGAGLVDIRSAFGCIKTGHYSTYTGKLTNVGDSKTYNMTVTSSDTCMRIAVAHGNRLEYDDSMAHTTPPAALSEGSIGVIAIKIYDPSGNLILSTYDEEYMEGTNLQVVEFDPREYGTGTYTIEVVLKIAAEGGRATNFGMAWR